MFFVYSNFHVYLLLCVVSVTDTGSVVEPATKDYKLYRRHSSTLQRFSPPLDGAFYYSQSGLSRLV